MENRTANKVLIPARLSKLGFETLRQKGRVSAYERFVSRTPIAALLATTTHARSGRTVARIGLRMMSPFPSLPPKIP